MENKTELWKIIVYRLKYCIGIGETKRNSSLTYKGRQNCNRPIAGIGPQPCLIKGSCIVGQTFLNLYLLRKSFDVCPQKCHRNEIYCRIIRYSILKIQSRVEHFIWVFRFPGLRLRVKDVFSNESETSLIHFLLEKKVSNWKELGIS